MFLAGRVATAGPARPGYPGSNILAQRTVLPWMKVAVSRWAIPRLSGAATFA
jgi:hypothetical protein